MSIKSAGLGILLAALSGTAFAIPSLGTITGNSALDGVKDTGREVLRLTDTDSTSDSSTAHLLIESAGYKNNNAFGIYGFSLNDSGNVVVGEMLEIFSGADNSLTSGNTASFTTTVTFDLASGKATANGVSAQIGSIFGLYLQNEVNDGGFTWYTHTSLNSDGKDHALIFQPWDHGLQDESPLLGSNVVIAFEDLCSPACNSDSDFNDLVVGMSDVVTVPEPGSLALLGLGLVALGAFRPRKA